MHRHRELIAFGSMIVGLETQWEQLPAGEQPGSISVFRTGDYKTDAAVCKLSR